MRWNWHIAGVIQTSVRQVLLAGGVGSLAASCASPGASPKTQAADPTRETPTPATIDPSAENAEQESTEDTEGVGEFPCPGEGFSYFADARLNAPYDYVLIKNAYGTPNSPPQHFNESSMSGTCDGECEKAVDGLGPTLQTEWSECTQLCAYNAIVTYKKGEGARLWETKADILALLGTIDTPREAALWADVVGAGPVCGEASSFEKKGEAYRMLVREMVALCPIQEADVVLDVFPDGTTTEITRTVRPETGACVGRRPEGLAPLSVSETGNLVGDYFAEIAQLEAAAAEEFRIMKNELQKLRCPRDLLERVEVARQDELRHAELMGDLARHFGAVPLLPQFQEQEERELFAFALHNATEGCVRETFGAAEARHQAETAMDPLVRRILGQIATDEESHAELSWELHDWAMSQLSPSRRRSIAEAQIEALDQLFDQVSERREAIVCEVAGVPNAATSRALLEELEARLFERALVA